MDLSKSILSFISIFFIIHYSNRTSEALRLRIVKCLNETLLEEDSSNVTRASESKNIVVLRSRILSCLNQTLLEANSPNLAIASESTSKNISTISHKIKSTGLSSGFLDEKPKLISRKLTYTFEVNQKNQEMICEIDRRTKVTELRWVHQNEKTLELEEVENEVRELHKNSWVIRFPLVKDAHAGNYTCIATNNNGTSEQNFVLKVTQNYATNLVLYLVFVIGILSLLTIVLSIAFCYGRYCCTCGKISRGKKKSASLKETSVFYQPPSTASGFLNSDFRKNTIYSTSFNYLDLNDF